MEETEFKLMVKVLTDAKNLGYSHNEMMAGAIGFFESITNMSEDQIHELHKFLYGD